MIGGTVINIDILVGLPGSGKTYYAEHIQEKQGVFLRRIDFDEYRNVYPGLRTLFRKRGIDSEVFYFNPVSHLVFDGLFTTHDAQARIVQEMVDLFEENDEHKASKCNIKFVYFKEDRETCLYNDAIRNREKMADITIKSADYEKPNIDELQKDFPQFKFNLIEKEVHKMNTYESKFKTHESYCKEDVMRSEEWCLGGTWGDCWGNSGTISAENQPTEFAEFDDLLTELCPNITMLQYKKLYRECVTTETRYESDYYGGGCEYAYYECDLRKLYELMIEMNLIEED